MTYSGNYQSPPPNKLTPGFPGNYPDGPPPIYSPPNPNPGPSPDDTFYLFKRAEDGRPDVSMFSYWNKPLIREAMLILEDHFEMNENNPNNPMVCAEYYEKDLEGGTVASCGSIEISYNSSERWANARTYRLNVDPDKINDYTQDQWVAIFVHELLHGMGFSWWKNQTVQDLMGYPVVTNASPGLPKEQFPLAYEAYQERFANATATPLYDSPGQPGSNLSHYPFAYQSPVIDGVPNPGFTSLMNPVTHDEVLGIDNEIRGTMAAYGYRLKTPQRRSTRQLNIPSHFVCGHNHYE